MKLNTMKYKIYKPVISNSVKSAFGLFVASSAGIMQYKRRGLGCTYWFRSFFLGGNRFDIRSAARNNKKITKVVNYYQIIAFYK